jgi:pilus assembly protein Flp/PilA
MCARLWAKDKSNKGLFYQIFFNIIFLERWIYIMLFLPREEGQGLVEYALILVLVAIVVIAILLLLGPVVGNVFSNIVSNL